jgi:hypothetical protein
MFHGTWTLLARSLRLDALEKRAHAFRIASIGFVFLLLLATHIHTAGRGSPGLRFFALICHLCLGLITVAAAGHFSTAITEEKEAGTLNLLLLANVPSLAILVGKSTTRVVSVLLIFIGIFPFALLALALGGATAHQVWAGLLALAAYLVLVANIGLLASVLRRTGGGASLITTGILVALLGAPFLLSRLIAALVFVGWATPGSTVITWLADLEAALNYLSIITRIEQIQKTGFHESAWSAQVVLSLLAGAILFGLSWLSFRRFCEYLGDDVPSRTGVFKVKPASRRNLVRRILTPRPWKNAIVWKDFHFLVGGLPALLGRLILVPVVAVGLFAVDRLLSAGMDLKAPDALRIALLLAAGLEAIALSSRIFNSEYRRQTLCTLALLPRSTLYLCYSKAAGCALVFLPYAVWFLTIGATYSIGLKGLAGIYLLDAQAIVLGCLSLVLMHLTACLSLHLKWGALPLSIMFLMILSSCLFPFVAVVATTAKASGAGGYEAALPVMYLTLITCGALQVAIGLRFRRAASE